MPSARDHYFDLAKREGYRSRAAYKLIEIDDRKRILKRGRWVLDLGAAPGSWLQVALKRVGASGVVVGVDLNPVPGGIGEPNLRCVEGDINDVAPETLLAQAAEAAGANAPAEPARRFDVILSDMAPSTTGDHTIDHHASMRLAHAVLDAVPDLLVPNGDAVIKAFDGEIYRDLVERARSMFEQARGFKPKASKAASREMYVVAKGWRSRS